MELFRGLFGPIIFNVFINDLLSELQSFEAGNQHKCNHFISGMAYADDLTLIAETPKELHKLISICENWLNKNGIKFHQKMQNPSL